MVAFSLVTFTLAALVVVLLPGPDTLVVVSNLLRGGRRQAARTTMGVLTGLSVWVLTAVLGLSAVLRASHDGYLGLRIAGGIYLIYMGLKSLRSKDQATLAPRRPLLGHGYRAGLLTDLLNPKVGVFFVTFLPGFVPRGYSLAWTSLLYGALFVCMTGLYFVVLLSASGFVTRWLASVRWRRRVDRCVGVVLIGFGLRLGLE